MNLQQENCVGYLCGSQ